MRTAKQSVQSGWVMTYIIPRSISIKRCLNVKTAVTAAHSLHEAIQPTVGHKIKHNYLHLLIFYLTVVVTKIVTFNTSYLHSDEHVVVAADQPDMTSAAGLDSSLDLFQTPFGFWKRNKLYSACCKRYG